MHIIKIRNLALLGLGILSLNATALRADMNIVQNGTFTQYTLGTPYAFGNLYLGSALTDWTTYSSAGGNPNYEDVLFYEPGPATTVGNSVLLNSDGGSVVTLSQNTLTSVLGQSYTLHFSLTAESELPNDGSYTTVPNAVPQPPDSVIVSVNGVPVTRTQTVPGQNLETVSFVGTGGAVALSFTDSTPVASYSYSSVVSNIYTTTPEPGFYGLMALGLGGLIVAVKRRAA